MNCTPKTSHSCLRKWYTMFSRWLFLKDNPKPGGIFFLWVPGGLGTCVVLYFEDSFSVFSLVNQNPGGGNGYHQQYLFAPEKTVGYVDANSWLYPMKQLGFSRVYWGELSHLQLGWAFTEKLGHRIRLWPGFQKLSPLEMGWKNDWNRFGTFQVVFWLGCADRDEQS